MLNFQFYYGITNNYIDITNIVFEKILKNNIIIIPKDDISRSLIFGDHLKDIYKNIKVIDNINNICKIFYDGEHINIDINKSFITLSKKLFNEYVNLNTNLTPLEKLLYLHNLLKIEEATFNEEFPEQLMAMTYINKDSKVLEIGGNLGRNSIIISHILENDQDIVTMECYDPIIPKLYINKNINNLYFHIENSALSLKRLVFKDFFCHQTDEIKDDYIEVPKSTFNNIQTKYNIIFDTLVVDCEGSLPQILTDFPNMLENIKTIIMENDYIELEKKNVLNKILNINNFIRVYNEKGGWGVCSDYFFEVWQKNI